MLVKLYMYLLVDKVHIQKEIQQLQLEDITVEEHLQKDLMVLHIMVLVEELHTFQNLMLL